MKFERVMKDAKKYFILAFFARHLKLCRTVLFFLNFCQNIIVLASTENNHSLALQLLVEQNSDQPGWVLILLIVLESIQILLAGVLLLAHILTRINKANLDLQQRNMRQTNSSVLSKNTYSIWVPRVKILYIVFIYLMVDYLFAVLIFYGFAKYYRDDGEVGACESLLSCFCMLFDSTFKVDGGQTGIYNYVQDKYNQFLNIIEFIIQLYQDGYNIDGKAIIDFLYVFIVLLLLIEILGGLIIDTFAELREANEDREDDKENYCFICGLFRRDQDKLGNMTDFDEHRHYKHNMWNYLYFLAYITDKEETEYSGIESYVAENYREGNVDWFPIQEDQDELSITKSNINQKIDELQSETTESIHQLKHKIQKIQNNKNKLKTQYTSQGSIQ